MDDRELLFYYRNVDSEDEKDKALDELYNRHIKMLSLIASNIARLNSSVGTIEDFLQSAKLAALEAYNNFDFEEEHHAKLSTYLYSCVYYSLLNICSEEWFIHCPRYKQQIKLYLMGAYNRSPEKKRQIEEKYKTKENGTEIDLYEENKMLLNKNICLFTDINEEYDTQDMDNMFLPIIINDIKSKLPEEKQVIFNMFFVNRYGVNEISKYLNIPINNIRRDIRYIRNYFKRTIPDYINSQK